MTERHRLVEEVTEAVGELNALLRGWSQYFCLGSVSKVYRAVDAHARHRLRQWIFAARAEAPRYSRRSRAGWLRPSAAPLWHFVE